MLAVITKNNRIVYGTGVSFAVIGTAMHVLNVASVMPLPLSHTWSTLAIVGFFLTSSTQIGRGFSKLHALRKRNAPSRYIHRNDVSLP